jgi:hypothetical protein
MKSLPMIVLSQWINLIISLHKMKKKHNQYLLMNDNNKLKGNHKKYQQCHISRNLKMRAHLPRIDMRGTSRFWYRWQLRREKNFGAGSSQKIFWSRDRFAHLYLQEICSYLQISGYMTLVSIVQFNGKLLKFDEY